MSFSLILLGLYRTRPSATSFSPALHALALALFSPSSFKTRSSTKASKAKSTTSLEKRQFEWVLSSARSGCVWSVYVLSVRKDQRHGPYKWTCLLVSKNKGRLGLFFNFLLLFKIELLHKPWNSVSFIPYYSDLLWPLTAADLCALFFLLCDLRTTSK